MHIKKKNHNRFRFKKRIFLKKIYIYKELRLRKWTCKRILRNRSWASVILNPRTLLVLISRLWSFLTLLINPSPEPPRPCFFFATTRRPQQGLGLELTLLPPPLPPPPPPSISRPTPSDEGATVHNSPYKNPKIEILSLKFGSRFFKFLVGENEIEIENEKWKSKRMKIDIDHEMKWGKCEVCVKWKRMKCFWKCCEMVFDIAYLS